MVRTTASGISGPADLAGKTVGELGIYGQDSGVSAKVGITIVNLSVLKNGRARAIRFSTLA